MEQIKSGDIAVFYGARHWLSFLVRAATRSRYSHTGLLYLRKGDVLLAHSEHPHGVQLVLLTDYLSANPSVKLVVRRHPALDCCVTRSRVIKAALLKQGVPYNKWMVAARGAQTLLDAVRMGWLVRPLVRRVMQHGLACSQFVQEAFKSARLDPWDDIAPAPKDVAEHPRLQDISFIIKEIRFPEPQDTPLMKEIRLEWNINGKSGGGCWVPFSESSYSNLAAHAEALEVKHGPSTHWVAVRIA